MSTEAAGGGNLLDAIMTETNMAPADEGYSLARKGVEALVAELVKGKADQKVDKAMIDAMIAQLDSKLSTQLDAIMRNKYARNPDKLTAWDSASHIERAPQRTKKPAPPAGGTTPPKANP